MTPTPPREEGLFQAAAQLTASERAVFLDRECGGNTALRQRLEALLAAHEATDSFMAGLTQRMPPAEDPERHQSSDEAVGMTIGRYKLLEKIGEGGCGVVYVAEHTEPIRRRVALKVIKLGMDTKQVVARFEAERQALALMDHPNIAKVLDAGTTGEAGSEISNLKSQISPGRPYFVMELVRGIRITEYCDQHQLSTQERLDLFIRVCQAIQHAHQKGIIHRDIKPSNILVTVHDGAPVPKVIDFGIAKAIEGRLTSATLYTQLHQFIGTPAYMSPEQAEMSGMDIDTRSDIYSLGVLLYELLTGRTPFDPKELMSQGIDAMRRRIREEEPVRPSTRLTQELVTADVRRLRSKSEMDGTSSRRLLQLKQLIRLLRGDLDWIVMKCLEKDRSRRYETANGLAMDLKRHLTGEPVVARPPRTLYRLQKLVRRNRLAFAAAGAVLLALIAGLALSTWRFQKEKEARERAVGAEQAQTRLREEAEQLLRRTKEAEMKAEESLRESYLAQAHAYRWSGRPGQRFDSLDALTKAVVMQPSTELRNKLRNEAIACLALNDLRAARVWEALPMGSTAFAADSQLMQYARGDEQGNISVRRIEDDRELIRLPGAGLPVKRLLFRRDRHFLAATYGNQTRAEIVVWDLAHGEMALKRAANLGDQVFDFSWDNQLLALGGPDGTILLLEVASGNEKERIASAPAPDKVKFNPQGGVLAFASRESTLVQVWDLNTRTFSRRFSHRGPINDIAWDADGILLAAACTDFDVYVWDVQLGSQPLLLNGHEAEPLSLAFSHRGDLLASAGADETIRLWHPATGKRLASVFAKAVQAPLHFSQDDKQLGCTLRGAEAQLFDVALGRECRTLHGHAGLLGPNHVDVSGDGRLMASAGGDGIQIWDLDLGKKAGFLPVGLTVSVFFHPTTGDLVASEIAGLHCWPKSLEPGLGTSRMQLGPAQHLGMPAGLGRACLSLDGQLLGVIHTNHVHLIHTNGQRRVLGMTNRSNLERIALSADGQWLAACAGSAEEVQVWGIRSETFIRTVPVVGSAGLAFSPNSQRLLTGTIREYQFWKVGTWEPGPIITRDPDADRPGVMAFSRDETLLAIAFSGSLVQLIEPGTARLLATLEPPDRKRLSSLCFSPDARKLVAATENHLIHVWDLPRIREQLAARGLDWDSPPYPPAPLRAENRPIRLEIQVGTLESPHQHLYQHLERFTQDIETNPNNSEAYHQRAHIYEQIGQLTQALEDFNIVIAARRNEAKLYWDRARVLSRLNQVEDALRDCAQAIELAPEDPRPYPLRARLYAERKEYRMAAADLAKWGELLPGNLTVLHQRAHQFERIGEFQRAVIDLTQVLDESAADSKSRTYLLLSRSSNYRLLGEHEKALADLQDALALEPDLPDACHALARFYVFGPAGFREPDKALTLMEKAIEREPLNGAFVSTLAMAYYRLGQFARAASDLESVLLNSEANVPGVGWFVLALSQHRLGRVEKAQEAYRNAMEWYQGQELRGPKVPESLQALRQETENLLENGTQ